MSLSLPFETTCRPSFAQSRWLTSGMQAFLFDDNTIRINWFWATALGFVKLRVSADDTVEALEILRLDTAHPGALGQVRATRL